MQKLVTPSMVRFQETFGSNLSYIFNCHFKEQEARTKLLRERVKDHSPSRSIASPVSTSMVLYDERKHINLFHEEEVGAGVGSI